MVKLNLRNANGACRHQRVKKSKTSRQPRPRPAPTSTTIERPEGLCSQTGTDAVDNFVDGLADTDASSKRSRRTTSQNKNGIPLCQGHQQPCRLRTVRKSGPNKGRKFYACPMDRHEQCNFFAWADDDGRRGVPGVVATTQDSTTAFVQRQVATYLQNLRALTVPELRVWAAARGLATHGKRHQLWTRIALYVRDEIAAGMVGLDSHDDVEKEEDDDEDEKKSQEAASNNHQVVEYDDDDDDDENDDDDLELTGVPLKRGSISALAIATKHHDQNNVELECKMTGDSDASSRDNDDEESDEELEIIEPVAPNDSKTNRLVDCPLRARLRSLFGHDDFRPGQEWTIRRCLEGQRTLLVAPTGLGKSLCYALPAAMQPDGVALVVSPLLSLIQDQLRELPPSLPAASLSGGTPSPTLLQDLRRGRLRILFVSPERLVSPSFRRLLSKTSWNATTQCYERIMPPVSLFCVDEAHCLSQVSFSMRNVGTL